MKTVDFNPPRRGRPKKKLQTKGNYTLIKVLKPTPKRRLNKPKPLKTPYVAKTIVNKVSRETGLHPNNPPNTVFPDEVIARALIQSYGIATPAAQLIGMDISSLYLRIKNSPFLKEIQRVGREQRIDKAENSLRLLTETNGPSQLGAVCFTLKCIGKERGYVERQEVQSTNTLLTSANIDEMSDDQINQLLIAIHKRLQGASA